MAVSHAPGSYVADCIPDYADEASSDAIVHLGTACDVFALEYTADSGSGARLVPEDLQGFLGQLSRVSAACDACLEAVTSTHVRRAAREARPPERLQCPIFVSSALDTVYRTMALVEYNRMCEPAVFKRGLPMSPKNTLDFVLWNVVAKLRVLLHRCGRLGASRLFAEKGVSEDTELATTGLVAFPGPVSGYTVSELVCAARVLTEPLISYGEAAAAMMHQGDEPDVRSDIGDYVHALELRFSEICSGYEAVPLEQRDDDVRRYGRRDMVVCGVLADGAGSHPKYVSWVTEDGEEVFLGSGGLDDSAAFAPGARLYALAVGVSDLLRRFSVVVMGPDGSRDLVTAHLRATSLGAMEFVRYVANMDAWIRDSEALLQCESTTERVADVLARCLTARTDKLETQARTGDSDGCDRVRVTRIARQEAAVVLSRMDPVRYLPVSRVLRNAKDGFWADAAFTSSVSMGECAFKNVFLITAEAFACNLVPKHNYAYIAETDDPSVYAVVLRAYGGDDGRTGSVKHVLCDSLPEAMVAWLLECEARHAGLLRMGSDALSLRPLIDVMRSTA